MAKLSIIYITGKKNNPQTNKIWINESLVDLFALL